MNLERVISPKLASTFEWERFLNEAQKSLPTLNIHFTKKSSLLQVHSDNTKDMEAFTKARDFKTSGKQYTHFYSLPAPLDLKLYDEFKSLVKQTITDPSIDLMFMPEARLHLTVCMLSLQSEASKAISILQKLEFTPLDLQFDSLGFIGEDVTKVKVIYAEPVTCQQLDAISSYLNKAARDTGLTDALSTLWHCTLLNTRYSRGLNTL